MRKLIIPAVFLFFSISFARADSITKTGSWPFGPSWTVCYSAGYIYMGSGCGVLIINDATNAVVSDSIRTDTLVAAVKVSGNYLYVSAFDPVASTESLIIYDVSNPAAPVMHGTYTVPFQTGNAALAVSGGYAYLSCYASGLLIVDVSNPDAPALVQTYTGPGTYCWNVFIAGSTAYVAFEESLQIIDVSTLPAMPVLLGTYTSPTGAFPIDVFVSGTTAYIACYYTMETADVSNPAAPVNLATDFIDFYGAGLFATGIVQSGASAFVSTAMPFFNPAAAAPLVILDVSDPAAPAFSSSSNPPANAFQSDVNGSKVYVADGPSGVYVMDWSNPAAPVFAKKLPSYNLDSAKDIKVAGNRAYMAYGFSNNFMPDTSTTNGGFFIFDISNPAFPELLGTTPTAGSAYSVSLQGNYAFVGDGTNGYNVIDISNPASPQVTANYPTISNVTGVYSDSADFVYGAENGGLFSILNFSPPSALSSAGAAALPAQAQAVIASGNTAYIAENSAGLTAYDLTNKSAPVLLGGTTIADNAFNLDLDAANNIAYVLFNNSGSGNFGAEAVSVANPASPVMLGTQAYYTQSGGWGLSHRNNFIYIGLGVDSTNGLYGGIEAADTTNVPANGNMQFDTSYEGLLDSVYGVACDPSYIYAADGEFGLDILSHTFFTPTITPTWTVSPVVSPTSTPTQTPPATDTPVLSPTFTATGTFTSTSTLTVSDTAVLSPTFTVTITDTGTATFTVTQTPVATGTFSATASASPSGTITPTWTPVPASNIFAIQDDLPFPNPGNAGNPTVIQYTLTQDADTVDFRIYTQGLRLIHEEMYGAPHPLTRAGAGDRYIWQGSTGVANGSYYYLITAIQGGTQVKKLGHIEIIK